MPATNAAIRTVPNRWGSTHCPPAAHRRPHSQDVCIRRTRPARDTTRARFHTHTSASRTRRSSPPGASPRPTSSSFLSMPLQRRPGHVLRSNAPCVRPPCGLRMP